MEIVPRRGIVERGVLQHDCQQQCLKDAECRGYEYRFADALAKNASANSSDVWVLSRSSYQHSQGFRVLKGGRFMGGSNLGNLREA